MYLESCINFTKLNKFQQVDKQKHKNLKACAIPGVNYNKFPKDYKISRRKKKGLKREVCCVWLVWLFVIYERIHISALHAVIIGKKLFSHILVSDKYKSFAK